MMKQKFTYALFLMAVFHVSCGQNPSGVRKDNTGSVTKDAILSPRIKEKDIYTSSEYTDGTGKRLVIQNGYPRGDVYTDPAGKKYLKAIFWTRITNETDNPLELKIDLPVDSFEVPWLPGKYYKVLVPPDTMTIDKIPLYNYGLANLEDLFDYEINNPSSLKRTIKPEESSGFYVILLSRIDAGAQGALRTGLSLKGQDLFYKVSLVKGPPPLSVTGETEFLCGSINLNLK